MGLTGEKQGKQEKKKKGSGVCKLEGCTGLFEFLDYKIIVIS